MNQSANDLRTIRIIWASLLFTVVLYGVIIFLVVPKETAVPFDAAFSNPLVLVLQIAGMAMFFMSFVLSSVLLRRPQSTVPAAPAPPGMLVVTPRMRLVLIIRWALIESAAIFGLMAAFIAQDARVFFPLGALAVGGMFMSYPSDQRLRGMTSPR